MNAPSAVSIVNTASWIWRRTSSKSTTYNAVHALTRVKYAARENSIVTWRRISWLTNRQKLRRSLRRLPKCRPNCSRTPNCLSHRWTVLTGIFQINTHHLSKLEPADPSLLSILAGLKFDSEAGHLVPRKCKFVVLMTDRQITRLVLVWAHPQERKNCQTILVHNVKQASLLKAHPVNIRATLP